MQASIVLSGHSDQYLGVWHLLIDGNLKLITVDSKDIETFLGRTPGITSIEFKVQNLRPISNNACWLDVWLGTAKPYDMKDPTEQSIKIATKGVEIGAKNNMDE